MKRIDTRLKLSEDTATYVKEQQEAKGLSSLTKTIEQLLQEHQNEEDRRAEQAYWTSMMIETVQEKVQEEIQWHFKQLQVGVNRTDRYSQMLLELMNGLMMNNGIRDIMPTSEVMSTPYQTAKEEVNDRMALQKLREDNARQQRSSEDS